MPRQELQILEFPPMRRVFLKESSGKHLIQIQADRFLHNWRKIGEDDDYPRYYAVFSRFDRAWERFRAFLDDSGFEDPVLQVWELTYVNNIAEPGKVFPADVWEFLAFYERNPEAITASDAKGDKLPASNSSLHFDWKLPENAGVLSMDVKHGLQISDEAQILVVELTCRGPLDRANKNLHERFSIGHEAIVNTFAKLTTPQAHKLWEKAV